MSDVVRPSVRAAGQVMTVLGPVPPDRLGITLPHEHLHMDATPLAVVHGYTPARSGPFDLRAAADCRWDPGSHPDNYRLTQDGLVVADLREAADLGVGCVVDLTPPALGRDPDALAAIARGSGVHVVMGTGHYLAATHRGGLADASVATIADELERDIVDGVGPAAIRPGILGEIGTGDPVDPREVHVLRAVARAATRTGLAASVHLHPWGRTGALVLDTLLTEGLAPDRIILGHLTTAHDDPAYLDLLLDHGPRIAFDLFGFDHSLLGIGRWPPSDLDVARTVARLVTDGRARQLLLSGDVGVRTRLLAYGGWGYGHLVRHVVPLLRDLGVPEAAMHTMLVQNPREVLTIMSD